MSLILQLLLRMLQLTLDCNKQASRMCVVPLDDMVQAVFGGLAPNHILEQIAQHLQPNGSSPGDTPVFDELAATVADAATRDWSVQGRLENANAALDELCTIIRLIQSQPGRMALQLATPMGVQLMQYLVLSEADEQPAVLLVGAVPRADGFVQLPKIPGGVLDQLQIIYRSADPYPLFKTEFWARFPPDPVRQRLREWTPSRTDGEGQLELYRRQMPGEGPWGVIASEQPTGPHRLQADSIDVSLNMAELPLHIVRTTVRDKYKQPLLIAERVLPVV